MIAATYPYQISLYNTRKVFPDFFVKQLSILRLSWLACLKVLGLHEWLKWLPTIGYIPPPIVSSPTQRQKLDLNMKHKNSAPINANSSGIVVKSQSTELTRGPPEFSSALYLQGEFTSRKSAARPKFDVVWLYRSPIPVGRGGGVNFLVQMISTCLGRGNGVGCGLNWVQSRHLSKIYKLGDISKEPATKILARVRK